MIDPKIYIAFVLAILFVSISGVIHNEKLREQTLVQAPLPSKAMSTSNQEVVINASDYRSEEKIILNTTAFAIPFLISTIVIGTMIIMGIMINILIGIFLSKQRKKK
jgi:hypothetical protein